MKNPMTFALAEASRATAWTLLGLSLTAASEAAEPTPAREVITPTDAAAAQALNLSAQRGSLRFLGLDLFPRFGSSVRYDNNILIAPANGLGDVIWSLSPALAVTAGDLGLYLPASASLSQLRAMLAYGLIDDENQPQRFIGVEYQPDFNLYTEHSEFNYVNQTALFSAGYRLSRLSLALDQDYRHATTKSTSAGSLSTTDDFETRLHGRYQLTDKTFFEANGRYENLSYTEANLSGYQEVRGEGWFNRLVTANLTLGAGGVLGYLTPQRYLAQPYEQLLLRGTFRASEKLAAQASTGLEWRQFEGNQPNALNPVFSVSGIYRPTFNTVFTLEVHRRELPSPTSAQNYTQAGVNAGLRQMLFNRLAVGVSGGFDNLAYHAGTTARGPQRNDNLISAGLDISREFHRRWTASLFYTYTKDDSNVPTSDYGNSIVGLRIEWRY